MNPNATARYPPGDSTSFQQIRRRKSVSSALLRAQLRRIGGSAVAGPPAAGMAVAGAGWLATASWSATAATLVVHWLTQVFVLCTGMWVATTVTGERLIELQETTPTPFRVVQAIRAGITTGSGILGTTLLFVPLHRLETWPYDAGRLGLLTPAGAVVVLAAVAVAGAALADTPGTTIAVGTAWLFLAVLWDPHVLPLFLHRGLPMAAAAVLAGFAWRRFGDSERNITRLVIT